MAVTYPKIVITLSDGSELAFGEDAIITASLVEETNPIGAELPINVLNATIYDAGDAFSVFNVEEIFAQRQIVRIYEIVDGIEHYLGKYYLDAWKSVKENVLEISAVDIIGVMDTTPFDGWFFEMPTLISDVLDIVLHDVDADYELVQGMESVTLYGFIHAGTVRDALQQVCFASGGTVVTGRSEIIKIIPSPLPYVTDGHIYDIGLNSKFENQPTELKPLVTGIELVSHVYEKKADIETVYQENLAPGIYNVIFDNPVYLTSIIGARFGAYIYFATEGNAIIVTEGDAWIAATEDFVVGPNGITITVEEPGGMVAISGYVWQDNQRVYRFTETGLGDTVNENILRIKSATLINSSNAYKILANVRDYYRQRYIHTMTLLPLNGTLYGETVSGEPVYGKYLYGEATYGAEIIREPLYGEEVYGWVTSQITTSQTAKIESVKGPYMIACVEKINIDLSGGFLEKMDAIGVKE